MDENRDTGGHSNDQGLREIIERIRVMRAYSRKERQVRQFQERTESLAELQGIRLPLFKSYQLVLCPLLYQGFNRPSMMLVCRGHLLKTGQIGLGPAARSKFVSEVAD